MFLLFFIHSYSSSIIIPRILLYLSLHFSICFILLCSDFSLLFHFLYFRNRSMDVCILNYIYSCLHQHHHDSRATSSSSFLCLLPSSTDPEFGNHYSLHRATLKEKKKLADRRRDSDNSRSSNKIKAIINNR